MVIVVRYHGIFAQMAACREELLTLPDDASLLDALKMVGRLHPALAEALFLASGAPAPYARPFVNGALSQPMACSAHCMKGTSLRSYQFCRAAPPPDDDRLSLRPAPRLSFEEPLMNGKQLARLLVENDIGVKRASCDMIELVEEEQWDLRVGNHSDRLHRRSKRGMGGVRVLGQPNASEIASIRGCRVLESSRWIP